MNEIAFEEDNQAAMCNILVNSLPNVIKEKFICNDVKLSSFKFIIFNVSDIEPEYDIKINNEL